LSVVWGYIVLVICCFAFLLFFAGKTFTLFFSQRTREECSLEFRGGMQSFAMTKCFSPKSINIIKRKKSIKSIRIDI
jgi:predicted Na+-dependent transporter